MRHGQTNLWPGLPAPVGGWRLPCGLQRLGLSLVAGGLLLILAGCGSGASDTDTTVSGCADSQCLTPTPDPNSAATEQSTPQLATLLTPSPVAVSSPGPDEPTTGDQLAYRSEPAALGPVEWATEIDPETHEPRQRVETFPTDAPVIYAVLAVDHIVAGTTVEARWSYNRTRLEAFDQSMVVESASTDTWLEFHLALTQPGTWPSGQYDLSVLVNGEPAVTGSVEVTASQ